MLAGNGKSPPAVPVDSGDAPVVGGGRGGGHRGEAAAPSSLRSPVVGGTPAETTRTRTAMRKTPRTACKRTVQFDRCVRMVLVPARRDLDPFTIDRIWWGTKEMRQFRTSAANYFFEQRKKEAQGSSTGSGDDGAGLVVEEPNREEDEESDELPQRVGDSSTGVANEDTA